MYEMSQSQTATSLFTFIRSLVGATGATVCVLHQEKLRGLCPGTHFPQEHSKGPVTSRAQREVRGHLKQQDVDMWPSHTQTRSNGKLTLWTRSCLELWLKHWQDYKSYGNDLVRGSSLLYFLFTSVISSHTHLAGYAELSSVLFWWCTVEIFETINNLKQTKDIFR